MRNEVVPGANAEIPNAWSEFGKIAEFNEESVHSISRDGTRMATVKIGGDVFVRNILEGDVLFSESNSNLWDGTFNEKNEFVLASYKGGGIIKVQNTVTGESKEISLPSEVTTSICLSVDGNSLSTVCRDGYVYFCDLEGSKETESIPLENFKYGSIYKSPHGDVLAVIDQNQATRIISLIQKKELARFEGNGIRIKSVSFSNDSSMAALSSDNGKVAVVTLPGCNLIRALEQLQPAYGVTFSTDNKSLFMLGGGAIKCFDILSGQVTGEIPGNKLALNLAISKDGKRIAVSGFNDSVRIYDVA